MARRVTAEVTEHSHDREAIQARLGGELKPSYLRDWVYGGIDGAVTTFAVVSGVQGAELAVGSAVILGLANLIADGFSMAAGNYAGTQAEIQLQKHYELIERKHIAHVPEGEREEVRQILSLKGFRGESLTKAVETITSDPDRWVEAMLSEEYGLPLSVRNPRKAAMSTFAASIICGTIPLLPYLLSWKGAFQWAAVSTGVVFYAIGSLRSRWSALPAWRTGLGTLMIGSSAASLAYIVGVLLRGLA